MNLKLIAAIGAFGVALAGAAAWMAWEQNQRDAALAALETARQEHTAMKAERQALEKEAARLRSETVSLRAAAAELATRSELTQSLAPTNTAQALDAPQPPDGMRALLKTTLNPEIRKGLDQMTRMTLEQTLAPFFAELKLDEAKRGEVLDILQTQGNRGMELMMESMQGKLTEERRAELERATKETELRLREALGPEGYTRFEEHSARQAATMTTHSLEGAMRARGMTLTAEKRQSLEEILVEEQIRSMEQTPLFPPPVVGGNAKKFLGPGMLESIDQRNLRVLNRAAGVLAPTELEQLRGQFGRERAMMEGMERMFDGGQ